MLDAERFRLPEKSLFGVNGSMGTANGFSLRRLTAAKRPFEPKMHFPEMLYRGDWFLRGALKGLK